MTRFVIALALGTALAATLALGGARAYQARINSTSSEQRSFLAGLPRQGRPGGYVSSDACRACHPSQYATWHRTFHRTMTQVASPEAVLAPFDGRHFPIKGGSLTLARRGGEFWMTARQGTAPVKDLRVGLVTGSHHMQVFWVASGPGTGNKLEPLPYAYLLDDRRWVPTRDTFLADPRIEWNFDSWNHQCIKCHATAGQPRLAVNGAGENTADSRAAELGIACEACHGPGAGHIAKHENPLRRYLAHLAHETGEGEGDPSIVNPQRLPARAASQVCGQCHGISAIPEAGRWAEEGFSYRPGDDLEMTRPHLLPGHPRADRLLKAAAASEPGYAENRYWSDGTARVSGREWTSMARSPCHERGNLSCLSCHSMHDSDPVDQLSRAVNEDSNAACTPCHQKFGAGAALTAHTHHAADSTGSRCVNCHMPYTTYGLLSAMRSHRIENPSVAVALATGRPDACNLCHLDRSLGWVADAMARWYGTPAPELPPEDRGVAAAVLWLLRGDAGQRALAAWSMGWDAARAASGDEWLDAFLALTLGDDYAAVRYIAWRSLAKSKILGAFAYDFVASPEEIGDATGHIIAQWARSRRPVEAAKAARLLMQPDGNLQTKTISAELARRDNKSMDLKE